jgi:hypothetical protein
MFAIRHGVRIHEEGYNRAEPQATAAVPEWPSIGLKNVRVPLYFAKRTPRSHCMRAWAQSLFLQHKGEEMGISHPSTNSSILVRWFRGSVNI